MMRRERRGGMTGYTAIRQILVAHDAKSLAFTNNSVRSGGASGGASGAASGKGPLVALPLPITPSHGSHGASRTVTACTAGAVGSVAAGCEGTR